VVVDLKSLQGLVNRPDIHRAVLSNYDGPYSLGIGQDKDSQDPVLVLQVPDASIQHFPTEISVRGESVPVVVKSGFQIPVPLRAHA
jgi:hypothetical protein